MVTRAYYHKRPRTSSSIVSGGVTRVALPAWHGARVVAAVDAPQRSRRQGAGEQAARTIGGGRLPSRGPRERERRVTGRGDRAGSYGSPSCGASGRGIAGVGPAASMHDPLSTRHATDGSPLRPADAAEGGNPGGESERSATDPACHMGRCRIGERPNDGLHRGEGKDDRRDGRPCWLGCAPPPSLRLPQCAERVREPRGHRHDETRPRDQRLAPLAQLLSNPSCLIHVIKHGIALRFADDGVALVHHFPSGLRSSRRSIGVGAMLAVTSGRRQARATPSISLINRAAWSTSMTSTADLSSVLVIR